MDRRDRVAAEGAWYERFDDKRMVAIVLHVNDDEEEVEIEIPCTYQVCETCNGKGSHVNPSIDAHGISAEEWANDWDEEDRETYLSGGYDQPCNECGGLRVVAAPDEQRLTEQMKEALKAAERTQHVNYEDAYIRRMESGGYG
jgi:hypothetical protein